MPARPDIGGFDGKIEPVDGRFVATWAVSVVRNGLKAIIRGGPQDFSTEAEAKSWLRKEEVRVRTA
jgi:hypothetical protein